MSVRLFVGNLPYDATDEEIRAHFSSAGQVLNVFVPVDRETGRKRGFAFVEFTDTAQAQEAIRLFNNQPFKGRPLAVNEARAKESRPPTPGGSAYRPGPPRPMSSGPRPMAPPGRPDFSRAEPSGIDAPSRGDRPNRKQFGPDAKPFRARAQKGFKPEGGKKAFKEKLGGQLYSMDDEEEVIHDAEVDNFALGTEEDDGVEENNQ